MRLAALLVLLVAGVAVAAAGRLLPEEVRDARVRWPSLDDELLALVAVWERVPSTDRAAILFEDESLVELQREFAARDADADGRLSLEEIVQVVDEFNGDTEAQEACLRTCEEAAADSKRAGHREPGCDLMGYISMRGAFDLHCSPTERDETAVRESAMFFKADELQRTGDPEELGLRLNPDGTIADD